MNGDDQLADGGSWLVGRTGEREALDKALDSARRGFSATLVVRGEAGIGKTSLLEYAIAAAADFRVLRVTGIESEMELGFAGLHQLAETLLPEISRLPRPQRNALEAAFGLADGPAPDRFLVGLAVLTLLANASADTDKDDAKDAANADADAAGKEAAATNDNDAHDNSNAGANGNKGTDKNGRGGVLCAVDDAQWLDQASADVLAFVARRLHADRIAFLFGVRDGTGYQAPFEGLDSVTVRSLPAAAARQMMAGLVSGPIDPRVGDQITRRAAGNPLALAEMTRELTAQQLTGTALLPDPLPLTADVHDRYWRKVASLPPDHQEFLLLAAAEPSGDPGLFERAADRLGLDPLLALSARIGEMVSLADPITFRHPLIRSAVYTGSPYPLKRRVHAALAAVSDPARDADRIAWHQAAAAREPDESIAELLERSAVRARRRGGLHASTAFMRRAAELTPDEARQAGRLLAAAKTEFAAGSSSGALTLLDQAGPHLRDARDQASALRLRGSIQATLGDGHQAPGTLLRAADALAPLDRPASREILLEGVITAIYAGGRALPEALAAARATSMATGTGLAGDPSDASVPDLMLRSVTALRTGDISAAAPFLRRALTALNADDLPEDQGLRWYGYGFWCAAELLDFDAAYALTDRWVRLCRAKGALTTLPLALDYLGMEQAHMGQLSAAEASNAEAREILAATGTRDRLGIPAVEVLVPAWRGQEAALDEAAETMTRECTERGQGLGALYPHFARTIFAIGVRDYESALRHARVLLDDDTPYLGGLVLVNAVEAAAGCGDRETADLALARLAARAAASDTELARGRVAYCRALVASQEGAGQNSGASQNSDGCEALFTEAIAHFRRCSSARVSDLARARLMYGEWLRRQRRRGHAVPELRAAHEAFTAIGAEKFAERAGRELAAAGSRRPADRARGKKDRPGTAPLTERESQIVTLVIDGATNAEVAAQLFISANTVDYHLRHIYQKLGVSSRTMLGARYRDGL